MKLDQNNLDGFEGAVIHLGKTVGLVKRVELRDVPRFSESDAILYSPSAAVAWETVFY